MLPRQNVVTRAAAAPALATRPAKTSTATTGRLESFHVDNGINWDNEKEVKAKYYPEVDKLLKRVSGATRTHIFDHTLRKGQLRSQEDLSSELAARNQPVSRVHVDYTLKSGVERLHMLLPDEADKLQRTPFAVIQVWRPLKGPVDDSPLGMLDVESLAESDYMSYTLHFPGRTGYNYAVAPDNYQKHRWYYAKGIDTDEAYVFKCYDSRSGRARFAPHTGFRDPKTAPGAPPRESIEIRAYVFWENEPEQPYAQTF
ncbi:hypothetical protein WJX73_007367 [Symbiochloris irregularis]|uniref:Uncharacterized protein n=1 Tax=Symbiochloris irregularis TaxID=706552 RepID=A0AAW1PBP9_9CHLO